MNKHVKAEKIVLGGLASILLWTQLDSIDTRLTYELQAKQQGRSAYQIAIENKRTDIIDVLEVEKLFRATSEETYLYFNR